MKPQSSAEMSPSVARDNPPTSGENFRRELQARTSGENFRRELQARTLPAKQSRLSPSQQRSDKMTSGVSLSCNNLG